MTILVFEDNLMWSSRLVKTLAALEYQPRVVTEIPADLTEAKLAVVNLGAPHLLAQVPELVARGVHVIGHAGHKEKDLLQLGRTSGCQTIATNSELTFKIQAILSGIQLNERTGPSV